jgi:hypothetical protein
MAEAESKEAALQKMDAESDKARAELEANLDRWTVRDVAGWWRQWYGKTGHKRLGRIMVDVAKAKEER